MRSALRALPLLGLALLLAPPTPAPATAADPEGPIDLEALDQERERRARLKGVGEVSHRVSRYLEAAQKRVDEEGPEVARALLDRLDPARLGAMERALVYRMTALMAFTAGDLPAAVEFFRKVLAEQIVRVREDSQIRYSIAQLYAAQQDWAEVVPALKDYFRYTAEPEPAAYYLLGVAHFQLGEFDRALEWAEKAVDQTPEPEENWLQLLAALYVQAGDYGQAAPVLEELVIRFPKKEYWVRLSLIYGAREEHGRSLAAQQVAYLQGFLSEDRELRRLVRSYLYSELPYPAAQVLEKGLEDGLVERDADAYELLANSWIQAREYERSLPALQRAAALAEDGNLFVRLGQVHLQREEWGHAAETLRQGIERGGLRDPGNAHLLLGISYYNERQVPRARAHFLRARGHEKTRAAAEGWIAHLERESKAAEALESEPEAPPARAGGPAGSRPRAQTRPEPGLELRQGPLEDVLGRDDELRLPGLRDALATLGRGEQRHRNEQHQPDGRLRQAERPHDREIDADRHRPRHLELG